MIFANVKGITIPEGVVKQIADSAGRVLWKTIGDSVVPGLVISYTGDYTDQADVAMSDGKTYRLLTLTGSGTLTLSQSVKADVWLCAGGNGGRKGGGHGGGGGNFIQSDGMQLAVSTVCTIGAGGSATSTSTGGIGGSTAFGALEAVQATGSYKSASGASGGGKGGKGSTNQYKAGAGGGVSTVPFMDSALFEPHSAGGGGGSYIDETDDEDVSGGSGGSNGADGNTSGGTAGGTKGGGNGGSATSTGKAATFYGSGGGGGGYHKNSDGTITQRSGGAGYQGVIYVRIPYDQ